MSRVFTTTDFERAYDWDSSLRLCRARYWRYDKGLAVAIGKGSDLVVEGYADNHVRGADLHQSCAIDTSLMIDHARNLRKMLN
jgi:hypothetical protein